MHYFDASGSRVVSYSPPAAFVPHSSNGSYAFSSSNGDPANGRVPNQGFEGLTVSTDNKLLFALLQSALIQDGGSSNTKGRYARLLVLDISTPSKPTAAHEYVVQLPTLSDGTTAAQSDIHYVKDNLLLMLPRDGKGNGNGDAPPTAKQVRAVGHWPDAHRC